MSQVDSSVGGKTGVNHPLGKNMIGAFYQPTCVLIDTDTLSTLPDRELASGVSEIVKYGLIRDAALFEWLEVNMERLLDRDPEVRPNRKLLQKFVDQSLCLHDDARIDGCAPQPVCVRRQALTYAIRRSCENKAEVVAADEKEGGLRATLNLGHTFGHAIETVQGYGARRCALACIKDEGPHGVVSHERRVLQSVAGAWFHGEAVAAGMVMAADMSLRLGWIEADILDRTRRLLERANLPTAPPQVAAESPAGAVGGMLVVHD